MIATEEAQAFARAILQSADEKKALALCNELMDSLRARDEPTKRGTLALAIAMLVATFASFAEEDVRDDVPEALAWLGLRIMQESLRVLG